MSLKMDNPQPAGANAAGQEPVAYGVFCGRYFCSAFCSRLSADAEARKYCNALVLPLYTVPPATEPQAEGMVLDADKLKECIRTFPIEPENDQVLSWYTKHCRTALMAMIEAARQRDTQKGKR